jgi:hypothetical protein
LPPPPPLSPPPPPPTAPLPPLAPPSPASPPPDSCSFYNTNASAVPDTAVDSLLYVSPSSYGTSIGTHIPTNAATPDMDENVVPNPLECCALCTGGTNQSLFGDVSRTQPSGCPIFFLSYALGAGWICQFHSVADTAAAPNAKVSVAYLPK